MNNQTQLSDDPSQSISSPHQIQPLFTDILLEQGIEHDISHFLDDEAARLQMRLNINNGIGGALTL